MLSTWRERSQERTIGNVQRDRGKLFCLPSRIKGVIASYTRENIAEGGENLVESVWSRDGHAGVHQ